MKPSHMFRKSVNKQATEGCESHRSHVSKGASQSKSSQGSNKASNKASRRTKSQSVPPKEASQAKIEQIEQDLECLYERVRQQ